MNPLLQDCYRTAKAAHEALYIRLQQIRQTLASQTLEGLADIAYALRESEKYLQDIRKENTATAETAERLCCLRYLEDASNVEPIRTEYCTATPDMKTCAKVPNLKNDPKGYASMMQWLGIDPILWDQGEIETESGKEDTEVVSVHWPGFTALLGRLAANGLPLPDGIEVDATYHLYKLRIRKRKGVIDSETNNHF